MNSKRKTRAYRWLNHLLRLTFGSFLKLRYRLQAKGLAELKDIPKPWLILPNHVMTWDPVFISLHIKDPIYFIASDANFRKPFGSWWLRRVGAIPTSKQATDFSTLRQIVDCIKAGQHVGLFPEGERTWDGVSLPIIPATAKLVRLAGASVIVPILKGAYQCKPRWSPKRRRGPVTIEYKTAIHKDEIAHLNLSDIQKRIQDAVYHDDHRYQLEQREAYKSPAPAVPLQTVLFTCPSCRSLNTMGSRGDRFFCTACGWECRFTAYGRFEQVAPHTHYHDTIRGWNLWQLGELESSIRTFVKQDGEKPLFHDHPAVYARGYKFETLTSHTRGTISLHKHGISFTPDKDTAVIHFPWDEISALNVVYQSQIEFYCRKTLHVFSFPGKDISGYKYLCAGGIMQGKAI